MRIFYDGIIYDMQMSGGVNRYFANIIRYLPTDWTPVVTSLGDNAQNSLQHPQLATHYCYRFGLRPNRLFTRLEPYYFRLVLALSTPHIFHPTYYSLLGRLKFTDYRCPIVITIHDLVHEIFADSFDPDRRQATLKCQAIAIADHIFCVSQNTQTDLLERYPEASGKTTVTPLATELDISQAWGRELVPSVPYFLYVGSRWQYKNFDRLLAALARLAPDYPDLHLCVAGSPLTATERQTIAALKLSDRLICYQYPSDRHLAKLYRCSLGLVYPSLYEGFGLPPLEAMACGAPAIVADTASLPEVVGTAALCFDPYAASANDDLVDCLLVLLESPAERDRLIQAGRERARQFSWEKTAAQTLAVYKTLL